MQVNVGLGWDRGGCRGERQRGAVERCGKDYGAVLTDVFCGGSNSVSADRP